MSVDPRQLDAGDVVYAEWAVARLIATDPGIAREADGAHNGIALDAAAALGLVTLEPTYRVVLTDAGRDRLVGLMADDLAEDLGDILGGSP